MPPTLQDILIPGVCGSLPRGHTYISPDGIAEFQRLAHAAARGLRAKRLDFHGIDCRSFIAQTIQPPVGPPLHILRHTIHPFIAAATSLDFLRVSFTSSQPLLPYFPAPHLVIPQGLLELPLTPEAIKPLATSKADITDIRHWRPSRVGDLVFNHYD